MLLNGKAPLPGQIMKFPDIAKTFRRLVEHGKDGFYKGPVAEAIVELIQSKGGVMELEDLANHTSSFVEPIKYTYADEVTVYEVICILAIPFILRFLTCNEVSTKRTRHHCSPCVRDPKCLRKRRKNQTALGNGT